MKVLVVTSCTGEKKFSPANQLTQDDFRTAKTLKAREKELKEFALPAAEMYTGMQHLRLMEGLRLLREKFPKGKATFDLKIVSAGYGLIDEDRKIVPYEVTYNTMKNPELDAWALQQGLHADLVKILPDYDFVFFLLGDKYLRACKLPFDVQKRQKYFFFTSGTTLKYFPKNDGKYWRLELSNADAKSFGYGLVGLKGFLFKKLAEVLVNDPQLMHDALTSPNDICIALDDFRSATKVESQPTLFELPPPDPKPKKIKKGLDIIIPRCDFAANYAPHVRYFIPEWDDRVEPGYDFLTDTGKPNRDVYKDDVYAHEMYPTPNYDGILVSKIKVEENKKKKSMIEAVGVHDFLRFDSSRPVMGDCGAFDYIDAYDPPYETEEILDYYERLGFNIGVSIDHLIVGPYAQDPDERKRRYDLTARNAADFLAKHKAGGYSFLPSGIIQGWDPKSYRNAFGNLVEMGYRHISIGGCVRSTTKDIIEILKELKPLIPDYLQLHLFGIARANAVKVFRELGVSAMDSASHLRQAWLGQSGNYYGLDGKKYTAIRVPPVDGHGVRVKKMISEGKGTIEDFRKLEREALNSLRKFDKGLVSSERALNALYAYDEMLGDDRDVHRRMYPELLADKPWQKCSCPICKALGIDVVIFRGNNRNRRRGFHNTYVFYKDIKKLYPDD